MVSFSHTDPGTGEQYWRASDRVAALPVLTPRPVHLTVLAAHPDDETLGAGGLIAAVARLGGTVEVVVVTDGEASHPASPTYDEPALRALRRTELPAAMARLDPAATVRWLAVPDGCVTESADLVTRQLEAAPSSGDHWIAAPWRADGHPDHDTLGVVAARLARRSGATLLEYPIWFWHWGDDSSNDFPWPAARRLVLTDADRSAKAAAVRAHHSQIAPLSDQPGDEAILPAAVLAYFQRPFETFVLTAGPP